MHKRELVTQPADPSYRLIALTHGMVCKVDTEDYDRITQWRWFAKRFKCGWYAARTVNKAGKFSTVLMHRIIMGDPAGTTVDHRHHDTLDNRKSELRYADHFQQSQNTRVRKDSATGHKGVVKRGKMFRVRVQTGKVRKHIGWFSSLESAIEARDIEAKSSHGEFSCVG